MRLTIIIVAILVAVTALVSVGFIALANARRAPSPFLTYGQASAVEAKDLGERLAAALSAGEFKEFDAHCDFTVAAGQALLQVPLFASERAHFIDQFVTGMRDSPDGTLGKQLVTTAKGGGVALLHVHEVDGRQRALLRLTNEGGALNYYDLVVGKDATGHLRVLDFYNYLSGQMFDEIIAGIALPIIAESKKTSLERLITGGHHDYAKAASEYPAIIKLAREGKHAEAMARWRALPEALRTSRTGLFIRLQVAQGMEAAEYQQAIDAITSSFPGDGALALMQIDGALMRKDYARVIASIDQVGRSMGGDPYLGCLAATALMLDGKLPAARAAIDACLAAVPELQHVWWVAVTIALTAKDHVETARLLTALEQRFAITFDDFTKHPEYTAFLASPEYAKWLKRPAIHFEPGKTAAVSEEAEPVPAAP